MARVSHIEKPQSPELQGFGEGDKFLSFLLVGSNSGVSGKTQNPLVATSCRFESDYRHHAGASLVSLAPAFLSVRDALEQVRAACSGFFEERPLWIMTSCSMSLWSWAAG